MNEEEELIAYEIPDNIIDSKRILTFRKRNWIEGIICVVIIGFIVWSIPFVLRVKIIFTVCIGGAVLWLSLHGIKDQSLTEGIMNFKRAKKQCGNYSFSKPDENKGVYSGNEGFSFEVGNGVSIADKIADFIKNKIKQYRSK